MAAHACTPLHAMPPILSPNIITPIHQNLPFIYTVYKLALQDTIKIHMIIVVNVSTVQITMT